MVKIVLDLHDIYNQGLTINTELNRVIDEAIDKKMALVEIIPGKGSGQLKKRVLRFLAQPQIKRLYHRFEKDDKNYGRIFVHFRHKQVILTMAGIMLALFLASLDQTIVGTALACPFFSFTRPDYRRYRPAEDNS